MYYHAIRVHELPIFERVVSKAGEADLILPIVETKGVDFAKREIATQIVILAKIPP